MIKSINPNSSHIKISFIILFVVSFFTSPAISLLLGSAFALLLGNPLPTQSRNVSKKMLQWSVVGLGFGMNLHSALQTGREGLIFTVFSVVLVMVAGVIIGRLLKVSRKGSYLIAAGTAICGGSAIAAIAPVVDADQSETSLSLATIFTLNAIALLIFPLIGNYIGLSQADFGLWAAIAIHDTSSVVGAGAAYGEEALLTATTIKLTRALWIIPLSFVSMWIFRQKGVKVQIPWFILWFVVAMVVNTYVALPEKLVWGISKLSHAALSATLFLIGAGLTLDVLRKVGARPLILGVVLWIIISVLSIAVILM